ncbi:MAG: SIS domain-containing protein [Lachnospiraceae bacterium]|nr:SIS domain-containing protein [Lachnospiraceae bacterium]
MSSTTMNDILGQLGTVADGLSEETVKACAEKIDAHSRVFVYGAGRSGLMLRALAMRLMQMGKCAYVVGETVTPSVEEGDLLILASASGKTHSVCHYAEVAKNCGVDLMIITAKKEQVSSAAENVAGSPLTAIAPADVQFSVPDKDSGTGSGQVMGSLFEQSLLLFGDSLVQHLAVDPQRMRKNHANLE